MARKALEGKISQKNQSIQRLEKLNLEYEASAKTHSDRVAKLQTELDHCKAEVERLRLRVGYRGAPYYQVIAEFFPDKAKEFVDENHVCKCNACGRDMTTVPTAAAPLVEAPVV